MVAADGAHDNRGRNARRVRVDPVGSAARDQRRLAAAGADVTILDKNAEKGEALFSAAAEQVVAFVREFAQWPELNPG